MYLSLSNSFKRSIKINTDSSSNETSEIFISESLNLSFKRFGQNHWFILYQWVIESFIQEIRSKTQIHPVMKQAKSLSVSHWIIHSRYSVKILIYPVMKQMKSLSVCHWIIHSRDLVKIADSSSNKASEIFISESLNHSFKRFGQKRRFIQ